MGVTGASWWQLGLLALALLPGVWGWLGVHRLARRMPPTQFAEWAAMKSQLNQLELDVTDLHDRFAGFQKRTTMREARSAKGEYAELLASALAAARAAPPAPQPPAEGSPEFKNHLRHRAFGGNGT